MSIETARRLPVKTALSGPAAGVIAAQSIATAAGRPNIVTCDMGGTSFDVSLVADGQSTLAAQTSIGFGKVVRTPMIEITTIGAGGGSIAQVDADGLLKVGPESAGSNPGPVCYGLGNTRPTVTDANLVLGRINAAKPIGGVLGQLDLKAAESAIVAQVGDPLGLSSEAAAEAILRVANANMAGAIRLVSIDRGYDPSRFAAMPFGGGGALHTGALIKEVGLQAAIVPRYPGITSALGCVLADMRHDRVQTVNQLLADADVASLVQQMADVADELSSVITQSGTRFSQIERVFELDMLYLGQTHAVSVTLAESIAKRPGQCTDHDIASAFDSAYKRAYGRLLENIPRRIMNFRVIVVGRRLPFDVSILGNAISRNVETPTAEEHRVVWINNHHETIPVYQRKQLSIGSSISGPALIEQDDTTIFIDPGLSGDTDRFGNLIIERRVGIVS